MSRFNKSGKYRNAICNVHKKERWVNDLKVGSNLRQNGHHIKASSSHMAFVHDSTCVGALAVLPLNACGRFSGFPLITGHSAQVTDFNFSPFKSELLATGSDDCMVKLWNIPAQNELESGLRLTRSVLNLGPFGARVENLLFHPSADNVLAVSSKDVVEVFDINRQAKCFECTGHEDAIESITWHGNGHLLSTMCKKGSEKNLKIFDPRAKSTCVADVSCHTGQKHSCCLFLSDTDYIVTAGSNKMREAELMVWKCDDLMKPICRHSLGTTSSGSPCVLYDRDTKMLFLALKTESAISFFECEGSLVPGQQVYRSSYQTKGLALVPKRMMEVMSCEIVRLLQLTQNAIVPISYHVQRKSYSDFHADLYPDTPGDVPAMTAEDWLQGSNTKLEKISLDPNKQQRSKTENESKSVSLQQNNSKSEPNLDSCADNPVSKEASLKSLNIVRSSKFRHIEGKHKHRSLQISKIPSLSSTVPGDSNAFQANRNRVAAVLSGSGGQIGVFELKKTGRLDGQAVPTLQNGSTVMDFAFDPFDPCKIVVACEDAKLRLWTIPADGLSKTLTEPQYLIGHQEKANVLQFHPQAKSLLATAGYDCRLLLWDLTSLSVVLTLDQLLEPLFCMAWSPNGMQLATLAKNHILSIFNPRSSLSPVSQMKGPEGSKGARVMWLEDLVIAVSGFDRSSVRTVTLFDISTSSPLSEIKTNVSPATLIPHFDIDTNLLFLTGKGDTSILAYEYVKSEAPYLFAVAPFNCGSPHQGVDYLPKTLCDVTKVEIVVGVRLTSNTVEQFTFKVPRTRLNYFQDDIYPDTLCIEESALTTGQWLEGENGQQRTLNLKPPNMKSLSEAPKEAPAAKKFASYNPEYKSDEQKKEELLSAMINQMGDQGNDPLPQENMDGADSDEWSD